MRSIEQWAAETIAFLSTFQPQTRRKDAYSYDEQLNHVITKLKYVQVSTLPHVLVDLYHFATFWGIPLNKVMPKTDEVTHWFAQE